VMLKVKGTNQIFWTAFLKSMNTTSGLLMINYWWNALNFLSANTYMDYILEFDYAGENVSSWSSREIRLNNLIVWDGFGWEITNLNSYSNIWMPTDVFFYRY
jgi:hypothetical protein